MNGWKRSIGTGKIVVELCSEPISTSVWRNRSWIATGWRPIFSAACESFSEAWNSPSAAMIFARRSRSEGP